MDHVDDQQVGGDGLRTADGVDCCLVGDVALVMEADGVGRRSHEEMVGSVTLIDVDRETCCERWLPDDVLKLINRWGRAEVADVVDLVESDAFAVADIGGGEVARARAR